MQCSWRGVVAWCFAIGLGLLGSPVPAVGQTVFFEDFESGLGDWVIDDGVWEIGDYSGPPLTPFAGTPGCASTVLGGTAPNGQSSRLISPLLVLPGPGSLGGDELLLRFWTTHDYVPGDFGHLQYRVYDPMIGLYSAWFELPAFGSSTAEFQQDSVLWFPYQTDLTILAGQQVEVAFYHQANASSPSIGWTIDEVEVARVTPLAGGDVSGGFESGWERWSATRGIWQVGGAPAGAPGGVFSGTACVGTLLSLTAPDGVSSRLVSPTVDLPSVDPTTQELVLRVAGYHDYQPGDNGQWHLQVFDGSSQTWGPWTVIAPAVDLRSEVWYPLEVDLNGYSGRRVRVSFLHQPNTSTPSFGWALDEVEVIAREPQGSLYSDFESGLGDWWIDNGIWEVGLVGSGPSGAYQGAQVAGTILGGTAPNGLASRLVSPAVDLPTVSPGSGVETFLRLGTWHDYQSGDFGDPQIQVYDFSSLTWSGWTDLGRDVTFVGATWYPTRFDLDPYAGQRIRVAFEHRPNTSSPSSGWFVDAVEIAQAAPVFDGGFESGLGDWWIIGGVWQTSDTPPGPPAGPPGGLLGDRCAGTLVSGLTPDGIDATLVSPAIDLVPVVGDEEIHARFWTWHSYQSGDQGIVQVSIFDESTQLWSPFQFLETFSFAPPNSYPTQVELTGFAGQRVRLGFRHDVNTSTPSYGWFIDDVRIVHQVPELHFGFEAWNEWHVDGGIWQIGEVTLGPPGECFSGQSCAGTLLESPTTPNGLDGRLISPSFRVYGTSPTLQFAQWHDYASGDVGRVQIQVREPSGAWTPWGPLGSEAVGASSGWGWSSVYDLTAFTGEWVRVSFLHDVNTSTPSAGWYLDNLVIDGQTIFVRADANSDATVDVSDAVQALNYLFLGAPTQCEDTLDVNDDGAIDVSDPVNLLAYLFSGGPAPITPFPDCGIDPTLDELECDQPYCP